MTFAIGGTAKVRRIVREARTEPWWCRPYCAGNADGAHAPSLVRCPACGTKRP